MKKIVAVLAVVVLIGVIVAATQGHKKSPSSNTAHSTSTQAKLDTRPGAILAAEDHASDKAELYQLAYDSLDSRCTDKAQLASYIEFAYTDLKQNGVHDETRLTIMDHLIASIPNGQTTGCRGVMAAYLVLREPK